jgi:hypothetical protein
LLGFGLIVKPIMLGSDMSVWVWHDY